MAGASDKARFYLEKSVPELKELQRKDVFSKEEVTSIVKKRSDCEHKLNARGSRPSDYATYAAYEMNLDSLRRLRTKRLGVKTTSHSGQRRIFFVLERATRKFPGDMGLWMQYIGFARKQKSNKKVSEILTQMIRLFPTKPDIWIYAANYALEERGDMTEARSLMQKGLRFCKRSEELWIEYAKLEMIHIAKIAARSKILGLNQSRHSRNGAVNSDEGVYHDATAEDADPPQLQDGEREQDLVKKLHRMPASSGSIPLAIFDAAMVEFANDISIASAFFDMVAAYNVEPRQGILAHISDYMQVTAPNSVDTLARFVQQPVIGLDPTRPPFPMSLADCLDRLGPALQKLKTLQRHQSFNEHVAGWAGRLLEIDDIDEDVRKVLQVLLQKVKRQSEMVLKGNGDVE